MDTAIICALITGSLALVGTIYSNRSTRNKVQQDIAINQAVIKSQIEELAREVREHNNFAKRMPVVEKEIEHIEKELYELKDYHK